MRRIGLWILLGCLFTSTAVLGNELSGRWGAGFTFIQTDSYSLANHLEFFVELDYILEPVSFGLIATLAPVFHGVTAWGPYYEGQYPGSLLLDSHGRFGAVAYVSNLWFDVEDAEFRSWANAWWLQLGGIEFFGLFFLDGIRNEYFSILNPQTGLSYGWQEAYGFGWALGGAGYVGEVAISGELRFSTRHRLEIIGNAGTWLVYADRIHQEALGTDWYYPDAEMGSYNSFVDPPYEDSFTLTVITPQVDVQTDCDTIFRFADLEVTAPLSCFTLNAELSFNHQGFAYAQMRTSPIGIEHLPWIKIAPELTYTLEDKSFQGNISWDIGEYVCITPFFRVKGADDYGVFSPGDETIHEDFTIEAILLECQFGDVILRAGSKTYSEAIMFFDRNGRPYAFPDGNQLWAPGTIPPIYRRADRPPFEYDEFIGIIVGGEACCSDEFSFSAFVWFDDIYTFGTPPASSGLFDIVEFDFDLSFGLTDSITLMLGLRITEAAGWEEFTFSMEMEF